MRVKKLGLFFAHCRKYFCGTKGLFLQVVLRSLACFLVAKRGDFEVNAGHSVVLMAMVGRG